MSLRSDDWIAAFVTEYGSTTARVPALCALAPLKAEGGIQYIGADVGTDAYPLVVTGPYIKLDYSLPTDADGYVFTGNVLVVRKSREFSRNIADADHIIVAAYDFTADIGVRARDTYDPEYVLLDQPVTAGVVWYYTIYYEVVYAAVTLWAWSPNHGHDRVFTYTNVLVDGEPYSQHGQVMFDSLPRAARILDYREGNNTVLRLTKVLGRIFDVLHEELEIARQLTEVDDVDAGLLPYVDWLLAWPTNYELPEVRRRLETAQAATLWKAKGTKNALELMLQTVTSWDVEVLEGHPWVMTLASEPALDPASPPADWVELTDGVWADLVGAIPDQVLFDSADASHYGGERTSRDGLARLPSFEQVSSHGVGWPWQNENGMLIILRDVDGLNVMLSQTVVRKVSRMAPLFALHYAAFAIMLEIGTTEEYAPFADGWHAAAAVGTHAESYAAVDDVGETVLDSTPDRDEFFVDPHPDFESQNVIGSTYFLLYHSWLEYTGDLSLEETDLPQSIVLTSDKILTPASPAQSLGQFTFNAALYLTLPVFVFAFTGLVGGVTAGSGLNLQLTLYNLTDGAVVASAAISVSGTAAAEAKSGPLILPAAEKTYEVRAVLNGHAHATDFGSLGTAYLRVG